MKQMLAENIYLLMKSDEQIGKHCLTKKAPWHDVVLGDSGCKERTQKCAQFYWVKWKEGGRILKRQTRRWLYRISIRLAPTNKYPSVLQIQKLFQIQISGCATNRKRHFKYKYKYSPVPQIKNSYTNTNIHLCYKYKKYFNEEVIKW